MNPLLIFATVCAATLLSFALGYCCEVAKARQDKWFQARAKELAAQLERANKTIDGLHVALEAQNKELADANGRILPKEAKT